MFLARKQEQKALDELEPAVRLAPGDESIQYNLMLAYRGLKRTADAQRAYAEFQKIKTGREQSRSSILKQLKGLPVQAAGVQAMKHVLAAGSVSILMLLAAETPTPLFVDVTRSAGLTEKTVFGGEKTKKYIIETTGGGVAFVDYDGDGWPDIFLVNGSRLEVTPRPATSCTATSTTAHSRTSPERPAWNTPVGGRESARAISITTGTSICLSRTGAIMYSTGTRATGPSAT